MRKIMLLISLMMLMILSSATVASAFEVREGRTSFVTVEKNETVDDDLLLAGQGAVIDGTVNGDVLALGDTITVNGTINGNLLAFGARVEIRGAVNGAVITAGDRIQVEGTIERSLIAAGSRVITHETANIGGSLIGAGDTLEHRGVLARGAAVAGADLIFSGKVGKEIKAAGDRLEFRENAVVGGPVEFWSDRQAVVAGNAKTGAITHHAVDNDWQEWTRPWYFRPGWVILKFGGFMALGLVLLSLFPRLRGRFPDLMARNLWQAPLAGFLTLVATPIAAVILMITIIGVPLGLVALFSLPILIYASQVFVAWSVGRLLADRVPALENQSWPVIFLIGAVLTTVLVEVPYFGPIMAAASLFYGLGAVWLLLTNRETTA